MKKDIFAFFKKKPAPSINREAKDLKAGNPSQIHFDTGVKLDGFMPKSKGPVILVVLLTLALGGLAYRYLSSSSETSMQAPALALSPLVINPPNAQSDNSQDQLARARSLLQNERVDESISIYSELLRKKPDDVQVLNDLGMLYLKKKRFAESEPLLKQSIAISPDCVECLNNLGYLKTMQGQSELAENYLKKAISLNTDYLDPYFNLGVLYEKNGDIASSVNAYQEFLRRSKDKGSAFNIQLKQHLISLLDK